ncbi:MAG: ferredoxin [Conexibacter sp.]|nr:ferredoxin [Conexibacter sp.]
MKVIVDLDVCEAYGQCVLQAPQVFDLGDDDEVVTVLDADPDDALRERVEAAADACPVDAIRIAD